MLSERVLRVSESATLKVGEKARELEKKGFKIYKLDLGEPDFPTPEHILEAAYEAIKAGFTRYTPSKGILELRKAISDKLDKENRIIADPKDIIVTVGAKMVIFEAILSLVQEGDEVLLISPCWVSYEEMVKLAGGTLKLVKVKDDFTPDIDEIRNAITKKTKLLIINSPNNPTGMVYDEKIIRSIADILMENNIYVISDEIYEKLTYGVNSFSIGSINGMEKLSVTVNGFSKAYAMTGWRLGYATGPSEIISAMNKIQQHSATCATSFVQKAAVAALTGQQEPIARMVQEFWRRKDYMYKEFQKFKSFDIKPSKGAFYLFPNIAKTGMDSAQFATYLMEKAGVAVTPGVAFGGYDQNIRISYANSMENLKQSIDKIHELFQ
jgi:aspartate aminotransferase